MARRRARRTYHGYGRKRSRRGFAGLPSISSLKGPLTDAGFSAAVGLAAAMGTLAALKKLNDSRVLAGKLPIGFSKNAAGVTTQGAWVPFLPLAGGVIVGLAGYMAFRKNNKRALAVLVGSVVGGAIVSGFNFAKGKYPLIFGDYVRVRMAGYGNVLVNQGALGNLVIGSGASPGAGAATSRMGGLAYRAMSPNARAVSGYIRSSY